MFRRRHQFGARRRRYRTPFSGSSYLYAADMDFRGRAATLTIGPVAIGDIVKLNVRWTGTAVTDYVPLPMTYSMVSKMLCEQGAPRTLGISGWATGFIPTINIEIDDYLRQWILEFGHRIFPSLYNTLTRYGVDGMWEAPAGEGTLASQADSIRQEIRGIDMRSREAMTASVARIWSLITLASMPGPTLRAYVHIPYTYLARGKPPRALRPHRIWVFAKTQLEHPPSDKTVQKNFGKFSVKNGPFAGRDEAGPEVFGEEIANQGLLILRPETTIPH